MSYIEVENLEKKYTIYKRKGFLKRSKEEIKALQGVNFSVERGEFLGYIGPNGAGKSTTIKILTGIMTPTGGEVRVDQYIPYKHRKAYVRNIGVVFGQKTQMWWDLPVIDTLELLKGIYKVDSKKYNKQLAYLIENLSLQEILHQPVRQLSLGQRMRAELASSMIHDPDILFLDEPTIGLDVTSKHRVIEFLKELNQKGKTIFLTTHDMDDIETLCSDMLVLNRGTIVYKGEINRLKESVNLPIQVIVHLREKESRESIEKIFPKKKFDYRYTPLKKTLVFGLKNKKRIVSLVRVLFKEFMIEDFKVTEPSIEEVIKKIYAS